MQIRCNEFNEMVFVWNCFAKLIRVSELILFWSGGWVGGKPVPGRKSLCGKLQQPYLLYYTQLYTVIPLYNQVIQLPSTWANTLVCCNTPSLTNIREPGWINHLPDQHYPHHRKQLGETCHSVISCIGIRLTAFFSVLLVHFFIAF